MANHNEAVCIKSGTGQAFWGPGDKLTFLITGEQTGGTYFMAEAVVPPDGGPPPHIHHGEDETFYILEGEITACLGDKVITASAGDLLHIPKGTPHSFKNEGDQVLKMIVTFTPAGIEGFFEEGFIPAPDRTTMPPMPTQELIARLVAAAPKYGLEIVLPAHE
jgi:quercetin dioxygenase-like cupin family protein